MFSGGPKDHVVLFHSTDDELAGKVTDYLLGSLETGGAAVVVATPAHRAAIEAKLKQAGVSIPAARAHGTYVALDAAEVLREFMINGYADPAGFWRAITPVIKKASRRRRQVRVFGEMVALLWADGLRGAAVDLEALWNELAGQYAFSLFCAYPSRLLRDDEHADNLAEILAGHSTALSTHTVTAKALSALAGRGEDALSQLSGG